MAGLILVPIDSTEVSTHALRPAERLALEEGASLLLVSVGELPETSEHARDARSMLQSRLDEMRARVTTVPVDTRVELGGDPSEALVAVARQTGADRIVMARKEGSLWSHLPGDPDVASDVIEDSPVPVHLVRVRR